KTSVMMDLIERTLPGVADPIRKFGNLEEAYRYVQSVDVSSGTLSKVPEKLATVVAQGLGWSDLGSFESVYELFQKDSEGNARSGRVRYSNARNNLILSKRLVALVDVSDMIVVDDEDAILVMPKGSGQNLKELVESMLDERLPEVMEHRVRYESWGTKTILLTGDSYEVSRLKLYPGRSLGPKRHFHRFIYWQVLSGTAKVTVDGDERIISRGEGIRVPLGAPHTLVNVGRIPLEVIEIATGEYLGSDDIEFLR
ncbi:MAG: cupin domain-containing protein, partial [Candidatus Korarchaeum sp.]